LAIRDKAEAMRHYARQANDIEFTNWAAEIRIRAEYRLGEMLKEAKETVGLNQGAKGSIVTGTGRRPVKDDRPTLQDLGVSKNLSSRAQKIASLPIATFESHLDLAKAENQEITSASLERLAKKGSAHVRHNSGENEWYTPPEILALARSVMGAIDLDPASCPQANESVQAERFYSIEESGLDRPWKGRIFLNPPYAQPLIAKFADKLCAEWTDGHITSAIVLVNNATETTWFQAMAKLAAAACFPAGRIRFLDPEGKPGAPLQGQAVLFFGAHTEEFCASFSSLGLVVHVV
jgi:ParB family chromosome partitioning protein